MSSDAATIEQQRQAVIAQYGRWTAHNIRLADGVYTMGDRVVGDEIKLRRILQVVSDLSARPLNELRIIDLACLEGLYAVEFALHGARVLGIEGRHNNIVKAQFAKEVLGLQNLELREEDVRNLSREQHGAADVVLCLGILYHLNTPDVFKFLEAICDVCTDMVVMDTHVSVQARESRTHRGKEYWGLSYYEYSPRTTSEEKERAVWASLDNPTSFWFTRSSLYNLLADTGFTSVFECHNPPEAGKSFDRITLVARKGETTKVLSSPRVTATAPQPWPERMSRSVHPFQRGHNVIMRKLIDSVPRPIKARLKTLLAPLRRA